MSDQDTHDYLKPLQESWATSISVDRLEDLPNPPEEPEKPRWGFLPDGQGYVWNPPEQTWLLFNAPSVFVGETRPWGRFEILRDAPHFKSKLITVNPGQRISYQYHHKRSEHWTIVSGRGEITLNDQKHQVWPGSQFHIPVGVRHRITNTGAEPLEFIEVQLGEYFGEDDIVRLSDDYDRVPKP